MSAARVSKRAAAKAPVRVYNARRDTLDFRDIMYTPTLVEVPAYRKLEEYRLAKVPVLDQGRDG